MPALTTLAHTASHSRTGHSSAAHTSAGNLGQSEHTVLSHLEADFDDQLLRVDSGDSSMDPLEQETALEILAKSSVAELRFLHVDENANEIQLSGEVRSFYHKQLAQEAMRPIADGRRVVNQVVVSR